MTERMGATLLLSAAKPLIWHAERMDIVGWIKAERDRLGWSQRDLAKALRVSPGAVGQWESGATRPTFLNLLDMANLFRASVSGLVGPGTSYPGELIEREDELLLLHAWRQLDPQHRAALGEMIRGAVVQRNIVALPAPPPGNRRQKRKDVA